MSYLPPTPPLHLVTFSLRLPENPGERAPVSCRAVGSSGYKRLPLWSESSVWDDDEDVRLAPADWIHHIALTALQDRPNTSERLLFSLTGGLGVQDPLF